MEGSYCAPTAVCGTYGSSCAYSSDCCAGYVCGESGYCTDEVLCGGYGADCSYDSDCCEGYECGVDYYCDTPSTMCASTRRPDGVDS